MRKNEKKLTKAALAKLLGVSADLVKKHCRNADAPDVNDVKAWQSMLAEKGRAGSVSTPIKDKIGLARLAVLKETQKRMERENAEAEGLMMLTADAQRQCDEAFGFFFGELERWLRELPPTLAGQTAVEAEKILSSSVERLRVGALEKFKLDRRGNGN